MNLLFNSRSGAPFWACPRYAFVDEREKCRFRKDATIEDARRQLRQRPDVRKELLLNKFITSHADRLKLTDGSSQSSTRRPAEITAESTTRNGEQSQALTVAPSPRALPSTELERRFPSDGEQFASAAASDGYA